MSGITKKKKTFKRVVIDEKPIQLLNPNPSKEQMKSNGVESDIEEALALAVRIMKKQLIRLDSITDTDSINAMEQRALTGMVEGLAKAHKQIKSLEKGIDVTGKSEEELMKYLNGEGEYQKDDEDED